MSDLLPDDGARLLRRRSFVKTGLIAGATAALLPDRVLADPYAPWRPAVNAPRRPIRVRGVVRANGRGVAGVAVTDGLRIVDTQPDGTFDFVSSSERAFVYLSLPAGYRIPVNPTGTARFYLPMAPDRRDEMQAVFELARLPVSDERHTALLLADVQAQDAAEMARFHAETVPDLEATIRKLGEEHHFGIACGDIVFDQLQLFPDFERAITRLALPSFQVVGNHDLDTDGATTESSTRTFRERFGPHYYSFNRGRVHYVVLDDVFWHSAGYLGYLDADQLAWLEEDLRRVEPGTPLIVSVHIPVEGTRNIREGEARPSLGGSIANREFLYRLVAPFKTHFLAGHTHDAEHLFVQGQHGHISGTVCGAWWSGPVCGDGTPNGYGVYEARGEEIRWRHKSTGLPDDHQIRTYARGAVPGAPGEIVANIWDWDPSWKVVLYEGADRRGPMAPRIAIDPLARELYTPERLPERRRWVSAYPTQHLLFAPAATGAGPLRVEATDRFGRVYSAPFPSA